MDEQALVEVMDKFALDLAQEKGYFKPPDRLIAALGRVVYFMNALDSMLSEIIDNSLAGPDSAAIRLLFQGESTEWKFQKVKGLVEIDHPDTTDIAGSVKPENTASVVIAKLLLRTRIPIISGYIKERNRVIHSMWYSPEKDGKPFEIFQEKRHRKHLEGSYPISKLERLSADIEKEVKILTFVSDVYLHGRRPNLNEELQALLDEARDQDTSSEERN